MPRRRDPTPARDCRLQRVLRQEPRPADYAASRGAAESIPTTQAIAGQSRVNRMNARNKFLLMLIGVLVFAVGVSFKSESAGGVPVQITNDGTDEVVVTVYDMNTRSHLAVLSQEHIYGFSSVPVSLAADESGTAHVMWTATSRQNGAARCGRANMAGLTPDAPVDVYADGVCTGTRRRNSPSP